MKALLLLTTAGVGAIAAIGLVFTIGYQITYSIMNVAPQENTARVEQTVQNVCDAANKTGEGGLEEACSIAQDTARVDYRCNYGASKCWVEDE